jgi:hypothetical protein
MPHLLAVKPATVDRSADEDAAGAESCDAAGRQQVV